MPTPRPSPLKTIPGRKVLNFTLLGSSVLSDEDFQSEVQFRSKYGKDFDDLTARVPPKAVVGSILLKRKELYIKLSKPFVVTITNHKHLKPVPPLRMVSAEEILKQRGDKS